MLDEFQSTQPGLDVTIPSDDLTPIMDVSIPGCDAVTPPGPRINTLFQSTNLRGA